MSLLPIGEVNSTPSQSIIIHPLSFSLGDFRPVMILLGQNFKAISPIIKFKSWGGTFGRLTAVKLATASLHSPHLLGFLFHQECLSPTKVSSFDSGEEHLTILRNLAVP